MNHVVLWACIGLAQVGCLFWWLDDRRHARRYLSRQGLPLAEPLYGLVLARLAASATVTRRWGGGGWALGVLLAATSHRLGYDNLTGLLVLVPTGLGASLGAALGVPRGAADPVPDGPRVARSHATSWRDYCSRWERWAVLAAAAAGTVVTCVYATAVWLLTPLRTDQSWYRPAALAALGLLSLATVVTLVRAAQALADRPQRARSELELAWDDALRSLSVRGLLDLAVVTSGLVALCVLGTAGMWLVEAAGGVPLPPADEHLGLVGLALGAASGGAIVVPWARGHVDPNPSLALWRDRPPAVPAQGPVTC